jgi:transposase
MQDHRTIVVADHHKSVFVCQVLDRETGEILRKTLASRRQELEPFLADLPRPALVYVEACRAWEWVSDLCDELGVDLRLVNPSKMPEIWRSTKKTDRADVEVMIQRLQVMGELPESHRMTRPQRELRSLTRRLGDFRHQRRRILNQIHAIIDSNGMPAKKESFVKEAWREEMKSGLSELTWLETEVLLLAYDQNRALSELLEMKLREVLKGRADYERLQTIPGVGPVIAATILAESAGIERFSKARQYAAFTGLVPRVRSSAGKARTGHITRCGPPLLRWALGQAAMIGLCSKNQTEISRMYYRKRKQKPGRVAVSAAAHKLARVVWAILARERDFRPSCTAA